MKADLNKILSYTEKNNSCLEWVRCFNSDGYPRANVDGNLNVKVHRLVWELSNNQKATGKVVRHICDNPKCINPDHLIIGTPIDNAIDRYRRDRSQGLKKKDCNLIYHLYKTKQYSVKELSKMFNVHHNTIYYSIRKVGT